MQRIAEALETLKMTGIRMTPQRHAILAYLMNSHSHPSADEIFKALVGHFPSMSVATVYNNLNVFMETKLIRELTYGDSSSRYDADLTDHYHAICTHCGIIVDFNHPPLLEVETLASAETGFQIKGHRLEVYGTCLACL